METGSRQYTPAYGEAVEARASVRDAQTLEDEILAAMGWTQDIASNRWVPPRFDNSRSRSETRRISLSIVFNQIEEAHALATCRGHYGQRLAHRIVARHGRIFRILFQVAAALDYALGDEGLDRTPLQEAMEVNRQLAKRNAFLQPFLRPHQEFSQTLAGTTRQLVRAIDTDASPEPEADATMSALHWHMNTAEEKIRRGSNFRFSYLLLTPVEEVHRLQLTALKILAQIIQKLPPDGHRKTAAPAPTDPGSPRGAHP